MGASTSWLAVRGKPQARILEELSLQVDDSPQTAHETGLQGSDFPNGWYVIVARDYGHPLIEDESLRRLSVGCELVAGGVESHVMCSTACGWKDGREVWWMDHDSEISVENLNTRGQMPPEFVRIHEELRTTQQEDGPDSCVDYIFSAPEMLTRALTGYNYDEASDDEDWHSLGPASPPARKSWLDRLLRR